MECKEKAEKKITHTFTQNRCPPLSTSTPHSFHRGGEYSNKWERERERIYLYIGECVCECDDLKKGKENERKDERYFYERKKGYTSMNTVIV